MCIAMVASEYLKAFQPISVEQLKCYNVQIKRVDFELTANRLGFVQIIRYTDLHVVIATSPESRDKMKRFGISYSIV